ncbi:cation/H(+) antiporter 4-like [Mercurialis annua]|uniref:cation/H(+) antiporter 4-like n=1 Tax=Mercurialis annua TaxID=3986 RepID=UPI00215ED0F6|nr:cation/H(+) antiporter 4-like [Mercurialis annua]
MDYHNNTKIICYNHHFMEFSLPVLEVQIGLIFIMSHMFHFVLKRAGISLIVSSMITGIILGPTFLGKYEFVRMKLFPPDSQATLNLLSTLGTYIFLFLSAVKMDPGLVLKTGNKAMMIGIGSVIFPILIGHGYRKIVDKNNIYRGDADVIELQSVTAFPVISHLIDHLKLSNSELGRLGLSSALVADMTGVVASSISSFIRATPFGWNTVNNRLVIVVFIIALAFTFKPLMLRVIRNTPAGKPVNSFWIWITMALAFLSTMLFFKFDQGSHLGPFIIGFFVPSGPPLGSAFIEKFEAMTLGILLPVQIATLMMRVDLIVVLTEYSEMYYYISIIVLIFAVKFAACLIPTMLSKMPLIDSLALAFIMSCKGFIELAIYVAMEEVGSIKKQVFGIAALSILISSTVSPVLVTILYNPSRKYAGYQARNVSSLKPDSELRILTCIHKPEDVVSVIRFLETSRSTKQNPICVYVLHLIELIGRATPVFLTYQKNKPVSNLCSKNVIFSFNHYIRNYNTSAASVNMFTAISPTKLMYEDICTLALDKLTSLILIPLHQKWSEINPIIDTENLRLRTLTCSVLEKAPCSVGIFFDGSKLRKTPMKASKGPFFNLCMVFLGGRDDREALTLAKRIANNSSARFTVIYFSSDDNDRSVEGKIEWEDKIIDARAINDIKNCARTNKFIDFQEHRVKDGAQTALVIHSIAQDYDLFLIGRRYGVESAQTIGLSQWSEDPELGTMGDLLTSKEVCNGASVLIVQQQRR